MKIVCFVNNYQYGMPQFKTLRQSYMYDEETMGKNHHLVWLDIPDDQVEYIKKLLNHKEHDNVAKANRYETWTMSRPCDLGFNYAGKQSNSNRRNHRCRSTF